MTLKVLKTKVLHMPLNQSAFFQMQHPYSFYHLTENTQLDQLRMVAQTVLLRDFFLKQNIQWTNFYLALLNFQQLLHNPYYRNACCATIEKLEKNFKKIVHSLKITLI